MALPTTGRATIRTAAAVALAAALAACTTPRAGGAPLAAAPTLPSPAAEAQYGLFFNQEGRTVSLAYGRPDSDDVQLMLQCEKGSRRVDITDVAREPLRKGPVPLTLSSAGARSELKAVAAPDETGLILTQAQAPAELPALAGFRSTGMLSVRLGAQEYRLSASDREKQGVARFFAACEARP